MKILPLLLALFCLPASAAPPTKTPVRPATEKGKAAEKRKLKEKEKVKEPEKEKEKSKEKEKENPTEAKEPESKEPRTASLKPAELEGFDKLPVPVQELLRYALSLTDRQLSYKTGSADPDSGGTDCSGFVYHILQKHGHLGVPRQSDDMYAWSWKAGTFRACNGVTMESFEFKELHPGDLLFWVNSTKDGKTSRDPPVTHVMMYLGKRASDGKPLAAGASDGRTYDGQRMSGVSVFDFRLPSPDSHARFIGYAHVPSEPAEPVAKPKAKSGKGPGKT